MNLGKIQESAKMAFDKSWQTAIDWALRICLPILLAAWGMMMSTIQGLHDHQADNTNRLTAIESSRYTSQDALRDQAQLYHQLDGIKGQLNDMERRLPTRNEFDSLSESIREMRSELRSSRQ